MQKSPAKGPFGPNRRARLIYDDLLRYVLAGLPPRWTARCLSAARLVTRAGEQRPSAKA